MKLDAALEEAHRAGVTITHLRAMLALRRLGPLSPGQLAEAISFTSAAITCVIDKLAMLGMVERLPLPGDRRSYTARLTALALETLSRIDPTTTTPTPCTTTTTTSR